jgi:hypothetical protein
MHLLTAVVFGITFFSLLGVGQPTEFFLHSSPTEIHLIPTVTIKIALYDSISPAIKQAKDALMYSWETSNARYEMTVNLVDGPDIIGGGLANSNYDVLVIGASGRQYFQGITPRWKEEVATFIHNGGGYVGICGGANVVSLGFEQPSSPLDFLINQASLSIANFYINDGQTQEWQYLWKDTGKDHIPLRTWIDTESPVFRDHQLEWRNIVYGGGPGMYIGDRLDLAPVQPIAVYLEEPMRIAPLHYWRPTLAGWTIWQNVTTDIAGQMAGVQTTFGEGNMVLFGNHPEIPPMLNGSIKEFFGLSIYGIPRMVYQWIGGEQLPLNYNWWIMQRSAAWTGGVAETELPPINST